jgi:membrane protein YdbS with pleckstrin-like domain
MAAEPVWQHPSPRLRTLRMTQAGLVTLAVAVVAAIVAGERGGTSAVVVALVCVLALGALATGALVRRVKAWGYAERGEDLLVRRGLLVRRLSVVPYGRMQFVDVTAGPAERLFRLATVRMHTAAAASDARIPGLPVEEAARLRDQLAALGEAKAAGL